MSHYIQHKLLPCREQLTVYRQTDRQTESIVEELRFAPKNIKSLKFSADSKAGKYNLILHENNH